MDRFQSQDRRGACKEIVSIKEVLSFDGTRENLYHSYNILAFSSFQHRANTSDMDWFQSQDRMFACKESVRIKEVLSFDGTRENLFHSYNILAFSSISASRKHSRHGLVSVSG